MKEEKYELEEVNPNSRRIACESRAGRLLLRGIAMTVKLEPERDAEDKETVTVRSVHVILS